MMGKAGADVRKRRLVRAMAIAALIVFAAPVGNVALNAADAANATSVETATPRIDAKSIVGNGDPNEALAEIERIADAGQAEVSESFRAEIGFLPRAHDIRATADGLVVGYLVDDSADCALRELGDLMQSKGWTAVPLGSVEGTTFVKPEGDCTWALATCTSVGDTTNVVFRMPPTLSS